MICVVKMMMSNVMKLHIPKIFSNISHLKPFRCQMYSIHVNGCMLIYFFGFCGRVTRKSCWYCTCEMLGASESFEIK